MTYAEKLKDSRWQKKRLELLSAANWKCQAWDCENTQERPELHVHHRFYKRNTAPWEYPDYAFRVLCENCHLVAQERMEHTHAWIAECLPLNGTICFVSYCDDETKAKFVKLVADFAATASSRLNKER
jgi:hypothetical protein